MVLCINYPLFDRLDGFKTWFIDADWQRPQFTGFYTFLPELEVKLNKTNQAYNFSEL